MIRCMVGFLSMAACYAGVPETSSLSKGIPSLRARDVLLNLRATTLGISKQRSGPVLRLYGGADAVKRKVLDEFTQEINSRHEGKGGAIQIEVAKLPDKNLECILSSTIPGQVWLHWGFASRGRGWFAPPDEYLPAGTKKIDDKAVQSPFKDGKLTLTIPESKAPEAIAFVVKRDDPEEWFNGPGGDFWVDFKPMDPEAVGDLIVEREARASHWSILDRMRLVNENIKAVAESPDGLAWIYTLLRFNVLKLVPLTRNSNYQSKELAHTQDGVSRGFAGLYGRSLGSLWARTYARLSLASVPRGGGNGDAIRLEILDIMRRHGIKEGHRPGIEDRFIEDWHQKLHTNCAPDDIVIAEAYIKFLESNNPDAYWGHLKGNGLSWEYMSSIGGGKGSANSGLKGMCATPLFLPQLLGDIKHLRWTLMQVHGGADLDFLIAKAAGGLDDELRGMLREIQSNRHEWWVPGKVTEARRKLAGYLDNPHGHRDALMLDVTLDSWFKLGVEKTDYGKLSGDDLMSLVALTLENVALSYGGEYWGCLSQFNGVRERGDRWGEHGARLMKATIERIALALQGHMDGLYRQVQPKAERLGKEMQSDPAYLKNFGEEVVRGLPSFLLSQLLAVLDPMARSAGHMGAWDVVSAVPGGVTGDVAVMEDMVGIQGKEFARRQVVVVSRLGGIEDIPPGVVAVLTRSATDILSHVAIRARNQGVLLATCHDDTLFNALKSSAAGHVAVAVGPAGDVTVSPTAETADSAAAVTTAAAGGRSSAAARKTLSLKPAAAGRFSGSYVVPDTQFTRDILGGKSNNLQSLRVAGATSLPDYVKFPTSVALPFGACERVLADEVNAPVRARLESLEAKLGGSGGGSDAAAEDAAVLREMRQAFEELQPTAGLMEELSACGAAAGFSAELLADSEASFAAVRKVWASKWSDRAYFSRRAYGVPHGALKMAVLVQQVVGANYAFVLHTRNPISGAADEVVGEVVVGLGEALVGNYPGRALAFVGKKGAVGGGVSVSHFPSKRLGVFLKSDTLIFRSDSNGEDLEGFAGAGLYESVMAAPAEERPVDYSREKLLFDDSLPKGLLAQLVEVGAAVEKAMGSPQDIEGAVRDGTIYIVQTRPQV